MLQKLSVPTLDGAVRNWSRQGSAFDKYVKALWIGIRAQRTKLEALGLNLDLAKQMFDDAFFVPTVNKILKRELNQTPNFHTQVLTFR